MYVKCSVYCATHTNDVFLLKKKKSFKIPFLLVHVLLTLFVSEFFVDSIHYRYYHWLLSTL